jgi:hypothetical protein
LNYSAQEKLHSKIAKFLGFAEPPEWLVKSDFRRRDLNEKASAVRQK